jgi:hypothetical protein
MMKKKQFEGALAVFLTLAVLAGCASGGGTTGAGAAGQPAARANPNVPDWYFNPPEDPDYLYGIGSAKMADADRSRRAAEHRARTSLAFQLNTYVKAMEIDYSKEAGTTNNKAVVELFENIDRQLASATLSGANVSKRFIAKDGTQFALISYPRNSAKNTVKGIVETAASREATIQANLALDAMNKAFAEISAPRPVETGE